MMGEFMHGDVGHQFFDGDIAAIAPFGEDGLAK